ncbi:type VI secretion system baseplate subunit TssK [Enterobacter hormaechei]|uniref:type VI secretion system baseplate subunit TssK n=4 Tax=Enterobacter hormaechei TaxID=158836 RepID=UPI0007C80949|nr:type VI secretion system baseplate subunit TssK [Enterobacter hormaechei]
MKTEQPLWGRGQMVSPQHFQQQAAYAAWSAECIARLGLSHPWGVINATFEPDVLKLGRLQARHLHLRFPDGTLIDTDNADDLPPVLALESETQDVVVVLALPLLRANGGNCLKPDEVAARPVRYRQRWRDVRNLFGDDTRQIAVMRPELTLRFAHQNNSDYLTCPVARLQQDSQGNWALDETYLPPLLALLGSRWLMTQLEQLLTQLRARLGRLMDMRRESNERMADFAVPAKQWKPFAAGMLFMLVAASIVAVGWQTMHAPDSVQTQLAASLTPLPDGLSTAQLQALQQTSPPPEPGISKTQQLLAQLLHLKPDWAVSYGDRLVQQALTLWPEEAKPLAQQWHKQISVAGLAESELNGWHQGMTQLQQLTNRLNALDEQKGKYMTVSELKSAVFAMSQSFSHTVPLEEQLRLLSILPAGQPVSAAQLNQAEQHLQQLIASYALLKHQKE